MTERGTVTFQPAVSGRGKNSGVRVRNTIKTYILTKKGEDVKSIAEELGVAIRSVYRYVKDIVRAEKELLDLEDDYEDRP